MSSPLIIDRIPSPGFALPPADTDPFTIGTPSMTNRGELFPVRDPSPRIRIEVGLPGAPEMVATLKPATLPCKAFDGFVKASPSICSSPIVTTLETDLCLSTAPIPVTTTSSRAVLLSKLTLIVAEAPTSID